MLASFESYGSKGQKKRGEGLADRKLRGGGSPEEGREQRVPHLRNLVKMGTFWVFWVKIGKNCGQTSENRSKLGKIAGFRPKFVGFRPIIFRLRPKFFRFRPKICGLWPKICGIRPKNRTSAKSLRRRGSWPIIQRGLSPPFVAHV